MANAAAFSGGYVSNLGPSEEGFLLPAVDKDGAFFWEGTAKGELRIQKCNSCGKLRHPPRPMCPSCRSTDRGWTTMSGKATIWSYVVPHPPLLQPYSDLAPYNVIVVGARRRSEHPVRREPGDEHRTAPSTRSTRRASGSASPSRSSSRSSSGWTGASRPCRSGRAPDRRDNRTGGPGLRSVPAPHHSTYRQRLR